MSEKKRLVRQALAMPGVSLPRLPKGELFLTESFINSIVREEIGFVEKIEIVSSLLDLDLLAIPYERSILLSKGDIEPISSYFILLNIPGIFSVCVRRLGFFEAVKAIARNSDELLSVIEAHTREVLDKLPVTKECGFDGISIVDDIAGNAGLFFPPSRFKSFFCPFLEKVVNMAKSKGLHVFFHSDGYLSEVLPEIAATGVDCLSTWDAQAKMDVYKEKDRLSEKVSFIGTIDLLGWDKEKIEFEILRAEMVFKKGRMILGSSCGLSTHIPYEKLSLLYPKIKLA
jgi:uroporphyrinogen decarboxylase